MAFYMELGRFRSFDVLSTFPMEFFFSIFHLVPGDPSKCSKPPKKGILTKAFFMELAPFRFVDVQHIPNGIPCFKFAVGLRGPSHWLKNPQKNGILTKALYMELGRFRSVDVFNTFPMEYSVTSFKRAKEKQSLSQPT